MGVSGATAGSSRKKRDDGGEICHGSKRNDYWRLMEGACEGRTEDPEVTRDLEILESMLERKYMDRVFYAGNTIFEAFVQELLSMPINLLLALYLVYPRNLFNTGRAYMFSRGVETLRIDGYLTLILLTKFHRRLKHGESVSARKANPTPDTYSYKCAAGLKTLLLEYFLMQNRRLTGEERSA